MVIIWINNLSDNQVVCVPIGKYDLFKENMQDVIEYCRSNAIFQKKKYQHRDLR